MQVSRCASPLHTGLTWPQIPRYLYHLLPCTIWRPFRSLNSHLSYILVPIFVSHLYLGRVSPPSISEIFGSLSYRSHISPIQVWRRNVPHPSWPISFPSRPLRFTSHLHPSRVSPQCWSWYLCLTSIHVTSQLHPVPADCILAQSRHHPKVVQFSIRVCHIPSRFCINCIQITGFCLNSTHVPSDLSQCPYISISPSSMLRLASIQVPIFASHLHPSNVSPPTSYKHMRQTSMQVPSHPIQIKIWVSPPSTFSITSFKTPIFTSPSIPVAFLLNPCPDICNSYIQVRNQIFLFMRIAFHLH